MFVLLSFAGLHIVFFKGDWAGLVVNFLVEATCVTNYVSSCSSSPKCGLSSFTVCASCSFTPARRDSGVLWLDQRPVGAVHFVVEATGVTQVVSCVVSSPQRGVGHATIHTLPAVLRLGLLG